MTTPPDRDRASLSEADAQRIDRAHPDRPPDARGLFRDDRAIRRWSAENALLLGGGCALLLEVAHPLVAAGVAGHSDFRRDPLGRLQRTLAAMNDIVFGDLSTVADAVRRVEAGHASVRGRLDAGTGRFSAGDAYSGRDPHLVRWVWATLVWTSLRVGERFVAPIDAGEREAFHADHAVVARLLGVPADLVPGNAAAFERYFDDMLAGGDLSVGDPAREIAAFVLDPPTGAPGGRLLRAVTTALLPETLRAGYGLVWDPANEARLEGWVRSVRALRPGGDRSGRDAGSPGQPR